MFGEGGREGGAGGTKVESKSGKIVDTPSIEIKGATCALVHMLIKGAPFEVLLNHQKKLSNVCLNFFYAQLIPTRGKRKTPLREQQK
jgi:hypothetical protein